MTRPPTLGTPLRAPKMHVVFSWWTAWGLFMAAQTWAYARMSHYSTPSTPYLLTCVMSAWLWALYTPAIYRLTDRFTVTSLRGALVHVGAFLLCTGGETLLQQLMLNYFDGQRQRFLVRLVLITLADIFMYAVVLALAQSERYRGRWALERQRAAKLEFDLVQARLTSLEAQLRPHFLFNSLNTIASLVRMNQSAASVKAIIALSDVLRASLDKGGHEVRLEEELLLAERYLDLERARYQDGVQFTVECDSSVRGAMIPPLVLQPLIENTLEHGRGEDGSVRIQVKANRDGDLLRIEVRDHGPGPAKGYDEGIGLSNTRGRLRTHYGSRSDISLIAADGGGAAAIVTVPIASGRLDG